MRSDFSGHFLVFICMETIWYNNHCDRNSVNHKKEEAAWKYLKSWRLNSML